MKIRIRTQRSSERGIALLYAIFGAFAAAGMVSLMLTMGSVTNDQSTLKRDRIQGRYLAEGAVEFARKEIQSAVANFSQPGNGGDVVIDGVTVPYSIEPTGSEVVVTSREGIQTRVTGYEVRAEVEVGGSSVVAHRVINANATPIFQFAVFYTEDLEILPGPDMTLSGRVHSNGDMFLGSGGVLTMDTNYVRAVGKMYRRRKNETNATGDVMIRKWVENPFDGSEPAVYVRMDSADQLLADWGAVSDSGYDSDFLSGYDADGDGSFYGANDLLPFIQGALDFWSEPGGYSIAGNTVLVGDHGVTEAVAPDTGSIALFEETAGGDYIEDPNNPGAYILAGSAGGGTHGPGFFHDQAGLAIVVDDDGSGNLSWRAYTADGTDVTSDLNDGTVYLDTILDTRQSNSTADQTPVAVVDLAMLKNLHPNLWPRNGLLYAGHQLMGEGIEAKGVQLKNGAELLTPLTTVSDGHVYVQGDYNTINKKGAAVIGDAVSLLSNDWDGSKVAGAILPRAGETTFNMALITGNQESVGNHYNGGLENLPRFHENWTGVNCNISGSFVNAWESQYATAGWVYGGDRYKAPNRNWNYDPDFNDASNLPPFTPVAVNAVDVVSW